jgi:hypothetical protein
MCLFKQYPAFAAQTHASMYNTVSVSPWRFQCYATCTTTTQSYSKQGKTLQAISHADQTENTSLNAYSPRHQTGHSCVYGMWYNEET